jgi:tetratricopeptide (TPR) repeat protein
LEKSLAYVENLMKNNIEDAGYKRNASITLLALGQAFLNHKEPKKALTFLLRSREISEKLLENDGSNGETAVDLASIYGSLGIAFAQSGEFDEGLKNQEKSLEFFNRCLAKSPENRELQKNFSETAKQTAETYERLAKLQNFETAGNYKEKANLLLEQSLQIVEK